MPGGSVTPGGGTAVEVSVLFGMRYAVVRPTSVVSTFSDSCARMSESL